MEWPLWKRKLKWNLWDILPVIWLLISLERKTHSDMCVSGLVYQRKIMQRLEILIHNDEPNIKYGPSSERLLQFCIDCWITAG